MIGQGASLQACQSPGLRVARGGPSPNPEGSEQVYKRPGERPTRLRMRPARDHASGASSLRGPADLARTTAASLPFPPDPRAQRPPSAPPTESPGLFTVAAPAPGAPSTDNPEVTIFSNRIIEMTYSHLCHILLLRRESLHSRGRIIQGHEY